ncbi:hypothetical protein B0H17DRAFT_1144333 [Mycena rosella]|uniref:Uncharacterized protein n=1 Tax=Mycena rosella TaxID=1033263 RepID=A0AAD7G6V9_MYCRO|nr:hypothetical protein B0H17DRAFT_1144333 [Mycena rosella]
MSAAFAVYNGASARSFELVQGVLDSTCCPPRSALPPPVALRCLQIAVGITKPSSVSSFGTLQGVATLMNNGSIELKLLNDPRTGLHTFETNASISDAVGKSPLSQLPMGRPTPNTHRPTQK